MYLGCSRAPCLGHASHGGSDGNCYISPAFDDSPKPLHKIHYFFFGRPCKGYSHNLENLPLLTAGFLPS